MLKNDEVPLETNKNHVSVGRVGLDYSYAFYNPHNARFYFDFNKWNFKPDMMRFKLINYSELYIEYMDCRIVVKKVKIEVVNKINTERRFTVWLESEDKNKVVARANDILEEEARNVLKSFISEFGGSSSFTCSRHIPDNKILHDLIVDKLPKDMTFRNDVVKKEYKDDPQNVEFSNPVYASNYFRNAGLRLFAPEIVSELSEIKSNIVELNTLKFLKSNVKSINDIFKFKDKVDLLSSDEKALFSLWSFSLSGD